MDAGFILFCVSLFVVCLLFAWGLHHYQNCKLLEHRCEYYAKQWGKTEEQLGRFLRASYPDDDDEDESDDYNDPEYNQIMNPDAWKEKGK